jgi:DNA polymerase-1
MRQLAVGLGPLDERSLEALEARHPVIRAFRLHRRYRSLARQEWLTGALCDTENRIHSEHHQLAAATGRNSCRRPNLAGLGRVLRPVVTAPLGRALVELDYCQMELAVAGAEYRDDEIVSAYNAGEDIYSIAAQALFKGDYEASERTMAAPQFRQRHPDLREKAKAVLLSILYGAGIGRIALALGVSEATASRRVDLLAARFPGLFRGLEESVALGTARGHASIISGLRRPIMSNTSENAARRVLRNTPIQGSAAVVFKKAIIDLDRLFHGTEVWVVLPIHDSVLLECAAEEVRGVAERAAQAMKDAMRTYYPALQPRVDVNLACTDCWNKDGHADSIDRWLEDFDYSFDRPHRAVLQGEKQAREVAG